MTTMPQTLAFGSVVVLGAISPGPDFAVVVRRSALSGRTHGMATAAGVAAGVFGWAVAAATGVAALVSLAAGVFTVIKLLGAGYLVLLGVNALRSGLRAGGVRSGPDTRSAAEPDLWAAFREGLLCNALNPKAAIFFVALLPQFLPADPGITDALMLSVLAVAITAVWFLAVANLIAAIRRLFSRPAVRRTVEGLSGAVLIGLGVRLAFTSTR
jgi:threonine/homoserine/homoserine lactone efflux protein